MAYEVSEVTLIVSIGTGLLLALGTFVMVLLIVHKNRALAYQRNVDLLHETHQREILTAQLEMQNQTLQQVAEDLHDHVGQMLSVVWLHLNCLHDDTQQTPYNASVTELLTHTATLVADVRNLSKSLSTDTITRFGLRTCLELELDRINRAGPTQLADMQVIGDKYSLGIQTEIILLRMVQEALNNALKHAPGAPISLILDYKTDALTITVIDQGPGFLLADVDARPPADIGQGLHNLRRRASLLGGSCTWQSVAQQQGTCVCMSIPRANSLETDRSPDRNSEARLATS